MKILLILSILTCGLTGCIKCDGASEYHNIWTTHINDCSIITKVVQIEGHRYIILRGTHSGTIIHAESCDCKK